MLIGTQMVSKGLHFPNVTLVGVLNSDASLNLPDFRAAENSFQQITQVSGRAGRGSIAGEVIIQTCMPENGTIAHASAHNYEGFYTEEIESRKLFMYPPFLSLVKFCFSGKDPILTKQVAESLRGALIKLLPPTCEILSVVPSGHHKVKDNFHYQMLVKTASIYVVNDAWMQVKGSTVVPKDVRVSIDVNPLSTFF